MSETYISVDVECSGPTPDYSLLSIGACEVFNTSNTFYVELKPDSEKVVPEALAVSGFDLEKLAETGLKPENAMRKFSGWLKQFQKPVMCSFGNFDYMFIQTYLFRYSKDGSPWINSTCMKSFYMGMSGCEWRQTTKRSIPKRFHGTTKHTHNALDDAIGQAELFANLLEFNRGKNDNQSA